MRRWPSGMLAKAVPDSMPRGAAVPRCPSIRLLCRGTLSGAAHPEARKLQGRLQEISGSTIDRGRARRTRAVQHRAVQ